MIVFQEIHLHVIDLAHPRSVFQFTQEFREQFNCLDALVSISYTDIVYSKLANARIFLLLSVKII